MTARAAVAEPFATDAELLAELSGITLMRKRLERSAEADGAAAAKRLTARAGKGPDGPARTREVKLAALFAQTRTDESGLPVRDENSTSYVGNSTPTERDPATDGTAPATPE
jgi:hypothetical protein